MTTDYDPHDTERAVPESRKDAESERSAFERDRARVLHSAAFRRLAGKTQVVGPGQTDFPRTRLTHTLECAQIGRELAAALGADADLVDTACLAHDIGHPPFGHNGELALDVAAAGCGGFEGNAQSLRLLTRLELKVEGAGLNLTRATLDAATKYPWSSSPGRSKYGVYDDDADAFAWLRAGAPGERRCLEAQVMDWADDVAYSVHDVEDGIHAGLIDVAALAAGDVRDELAALAAKVYSDASPEELRNSLDALFARSWWPAAYEGSAHDAIALKRATSEITGRFCSTVLTATRAQYGGGPLHRYAADLVVPRDVRLECALLKAVALRFVMQRPGAEEAQHAERVLVAELVEAVAAGAPDTLEPALRAAYAAAPDEAGRRRVVVDQVASLTDASARRMHGKLTR